MPRGCRWSSYRFEALIALIGSVCVGQAWGQVRERNAPRLFPIESKRDPVLDPDPLSPIEAMSERPIGLPEGFKIIEGDIVVPQTYPNSVAATFASNPWPGGVVPYQFDLNVSGLNRERALEAMVEWEARADVTFIPRTTQSSYVHIFSGSGNWSFVGRIGGRQDLSIFNWTFKYIIAHELAHALTFWHEQSRPDRDTYVQIEWDNIAAECGDGNDPCDSNFFLHAGAGTAGPYDFDSVMHYGATAFTCCCLSHCRTITMRPGFEQYQNSIGQRTHLSEWDGRGMAAVYGFSGPDCNANFVRDTHEVQTGAVVDCNGNDVPDECDIADGEPDPDGDGILPICNELWPDECVDAIPIGEGDTTIYTVHATTSGSGLLPITCLEGSSGLLIGKDIWYVFTPTATGPVEISTCGQAGFDSRLAAYSGDCGNLQLLACNDDASGCDGGTSRMEVSAVAGQDVYLRIGGVTSGTSATADAGWATLRVASSAPAGVLSEPSPTARQRTLSFVVPAEGAGEETALRVTLASLYHPSDPQPVDAPNFSLQEGKLRFVNLLRNDNGDPITSCLDSAAFSTFYPCATLGCQPEYADWAGLFGGEAVRVSGAAIVPDSVYLVAHLAASCAGNEATCAAASTGLEVVTARHGDANSSGAVDVTDVVMVVDRVKDGFGALPEYACYVRNQTPKPHNDAPTVTDVIFHVDALKLTAYTFTVPACP